MLKENIRMRKIGLGWSWIDDAWSKGGRPFSVEELTKRLYDIIAKEGRSKGWEIPLHPPIKTPSRAHTVALGTTTNNVKSLDEKYLGDATELRKSAAKLLRQREARGEGSVSHECQPPKQPTVTELVKDRVEVYTEVYVGTKKQLIWWAGEVLHVEDEEKRTVMISWDPLEDVAGWEEGGVSVQKLADRKWRVHTKGAWRMEHIDKDDIGCIR